jgi:hypothetical protein
MLADFLSDNSKFAFIAIQRAYTELDRSTDLPLKLSNGICVLSKLPIEIENEWKEWIGTLRCRELEKANLFFIFSIKSDNPEILDAQHKTIGEKLINFFNALQLNGVLEYSNLNLIIGSYYENNSVIRQMAKLDQFYQTKGSNPSSLNKESLCRTVLLEKGLDDINNRNNSFFKLIRGWHALMRGLQSAIGEDRIHQFVRSLEALILPEIGKTKKQFINRCKTFAIENIDSHVIFDEAFALRSMCEHLNDWNNALKSYPANERENQAFLRTRQMERLACFTYSKILENTAIRNNFKSEKDINVFWELDAKTRIKQWGHQIDLSNVT